MKSYDVVTVGSAILDVFVKSDQFKVISSNQVVGGVAMCEVFGGKMEVDEVGLVSGGGGTNVAVGLAKKELKTACMVEMGSDVQARLIESELEKEGVDLDLVIKEKKEQTSVSVVLVAESGERSIMIHRGASSLLDKKDLKLLDKVKTRWLHISSLGGNIKALKYLLDWAEKNKVRVSLNPGKGEIKYRKKLLSWLDKVEVLFLNREEARELFQIAFDKDDVWKNKHCLIGTRVILITDGERGGKMCVNGRCRFWQRKRVKVVDTTGAGDAFVSGFVSAVLYGLSYEEAVEWGRRNSAGVVQKVGAKKGLLTLAEIKG